MMTGKTPVRQRRPMDETARLGDEIYERDICRQVASEHGGEYVAIDVNSGSWTISDDLLAAVQCLRDRCPEAIDVWSVRVGHRVIGSIGGGASRCST